MMDPPCAHSQLHTDSWRLYLDSACTKLVTGGAGLASLEMPC